MNSLIQIVAFSKNCCSILFFCQKSSAVPRISLTAWCSNVFATLVAKKYQCSYFLLSLRHLMRIQNILRIKHPLNSVHQFQVFCRKGFSEIWLLGKASFLLCSLYFFKPTNSIYTNDYTITSVIPHPYFKECGALRSSHTYISSLNNLLYQTSYIIHQSYPFHLITCL